MTAILAAAAPGFDAELQVCSAGSDSGERYTKGLPTKILISAGEASSDRYAAELVEALRARIPDAEFFGCAGPRMRQTGVRPVMRSEELTVIGVFEVLLHIPRIYARLLHLTRTARRERPAVAIVTDAPGFHIPLAQKMQRSGIPVFYYVAPQVWAWRRWRIHKIRRIVKHVLCIFPFEETYYQQRRVPTTFVGHPLAGRVQPAMTRQEFYGRNGFSPDRPLVALLPGSREAEAARHLPALADAVARLRKQKPLNFVLPASSTVSGDFFRQRIGGAGVQIVEGQTEDALAHADVTLVASGTATVEAALLGAPMVVFYRVTAPTWFAGKFLVDIPFYSMVNLLAGRRIVPELIQGDCTGERLAVEARRLLEDEPARRKMKQDLASVRDSLLGGVPAAERAAEVICEKLQIRGIPGQVGLGSVAVS
jgi:lipid-A-disaccharide synthase